nr:hypothetical protein [Tanacetum cinerariifolium]
LVSSKKELREVEEDLAKNSKDGVGLSFNALMLAIKRWTFDNFSRRLSSSISSTSGERLKREYHSIHQTNTETSTEFMQRSQQSRGPFDGYSYPVCTTCGRRHPGKCRRAAGTCFKCGQTDHLQKDCKKNTTASTSGQANKKPGASGRVFAITDDHATKTSGTITGTLFIYGHVVFELFDTGATHSVISSVFASRVTTTPTLLDHFWSTSMAKTINGEVQLHAKVDGKKIIVTESSVRRDLRLADEEGCHKELGDRLLRVATTASSLEVEHDNGGGLWCQETMRNTIAQTRFERVSKHTNDSLLARGNTLQSDEDRVKLDELMALCTSLQNKVLDLEKTKTTQHNEIASLKRRVKKLEKNNRSRTHKLKRLYKVSLSTKVESSSDEESLGEDASKQRRRINAINADEDITMVNDADKEMFDVYVIGGDEVFVAGKIKNVVEEVVDAD